MSFGFGFGQFGFGTRQGGGGDPTALTASNADARLTALGLTQAGTGTTWGETGQAATPLYAVAAAKVPLAVETIGEKKYFGPIVNPSGTSISQYTDATNAAWVKTNCTASLQTGSLSDAAAANGHTLLTATADNATVTQSITSASGERVSKFWVSTDDEDVFVSHGAPTGSALYEDAFGSDTSGEWTRIGAGNGTVGVAAGILTYTSGSTDGGFNGFYRPVSGFTVGKLYVVEFVDTGGTAADKRYRISSSTGGGGSYKEIYSAGKLYFLASATTLYVHVDINGGSTGDTNTVSGITIYEVAETELTPGTNPVAVDLAAYTGANPQLGIRIATSGDSVRLYGVQHQVASRPLRPRIGPTAGSSVTTGARTMIATLSESPSLVSLKILAKTPTINISGLTLFSVDDNAATNLIDLKANGGGGFVLRKIIASSETAFSAFDIAVDTLFQIDVEISASVFRYRIDGGSWVDGTAGIPGTLSRFRVGHDNANGNQWGAVPVALDELSTAAMLTGDRGWNKGALT